MRQDGLRERWRLTLPLALATAMAGCCTQTATVETACSAFRPISWSVDDTPETIAEIKAHNARHKAYCEGR